MQLIVRNVNSLSFLRSRWASPRPRRLLLLCARLVNLQTDLQGQRFSKSKVRCIRSPPKLTFCSRSKDFNLSPEWFYTTDANYLFNHVYINGNSVYIKVNRFLYRTILKQANPAEFISNLFQNLKTYQFFTISDYITVC